MRSIRQAFYLTRLLWWQERSDLRLLVFNGLLLPLTLVYYGTRLYAGRPLELTQFMGGAATMSLTMTAMTQVGLSVVGDRFTGRLTTLAYACRGRLGYFLARNVIVVVQSLLVAGGLLALLALFHITGPLDLGALGVALGVAGLGSIAIGALGAMIGARARDAEAGETAVGISAIALSLASPAFYTVAGTPWWLKCVAMASPLTSVASILTSLFRGQPPSLLSLVGLLVSAAVTSVVAFRLFEWK